jgi:hypothetical protein
VQAGAMQIDQRYMLSITLTIIWNYLIIAFSVLCSFVAIGGLLSGVYQNTISNVNVMSIIAAFPVVPVFLSRMARLRLREGDLKGFFALSVSISGAALFVAAVRFATA